MVIKKARKILNFLPMWLQIPCQLRVHQLQCSHCPVTGVFHLGVIPWDVTEDLPNPAVRKLPPSASHSSRRNKAEEGGRHPGGPRGHGGLGTPDSSGQPQICGETETACLWGVARTPEHVTAEAVVLSLATEPVSELGWGQEEGGLPGHWLE